LFTKVAYSFEKRELLVEMHTILLFFDF
jgi:hypothetical protein